MFASYIMLLEWWNWGRRIDEASGRPYLSGALRVTTVTKREALWWPRNEPIQLYPHVVTNCWKQNKTKRVTLTVPLVTFPACSNIDQLFCSVRIFCQLPPCLVLICGQFKWRLMTQHATQSHYCVTYCWLYQWEKGGDNAISSRNVEITKCPTAVRSRLLEAK
jgi:hypothetical protein